jgi:hypothetical protein
VSFALITFSFVSVFLIWPHPLPTTRDLQRNAMVDVVGLWSAPPRCSPG